MAIVKLGQLLKSGTGDKLDRLVEHSQNMGNLAQLLRASLPADAAGHLLAANLKEPGELVLICSSSSWAARLRYESEQLLKAARKAGMKADHCSIKVHRP
ncbi:MAG TPA: DciA family protein [Woeseiaceae bacterium]|nr:DciA family protein [Woeseiaceae bacterium]